MCARYISEVDDEFNSEDAQERPWAYDHTAAMGAGLLNLAEELGNISKACKVMGVSRDTFYRYQELVEEGGVPRRTILQAA